ncbi:MAG TPA: S-layer homology domain-containing protein [Candidatus Atribacteria bacterium]|nr:S-layer homology domain-containing protein [Candidatus Atribacteria bacterium]
MKTMKKIVLAVVLVLALALPALANPFVDVPLNHWAYDAVQSVAAKGIFIGYPDGTFGGNRAATRYEFAMATARMLAYMEQRIDEAGFATQEDVAMLEKLVQEFADELRLLGVTVDDLKRALGEQSEAVKALEARVDVLERYHEPVLVTGEFKTTYEAYSPTADGKLVPTFKDETTLHIAADINENTIAGVDLIIKNALATTAGGDTEVTADNFYIEYEDEEWLVRFGDIAISKLDLGLVLGKYQTDNDAEDLDFEGVYVTYAEEDSDTTFRLLAAPNDFYSLRAEWEEVSVAATWFPEGDTLFNADAAENILSDLVISAGVETDFDESDVSLAVEGAYGVLQGGYGVAGELTFDASEDITITLDGHLITANFTPALDDGKSSSFSADEMGGGVKATFDLSNDEDEDEWGLEVGYGYAVKASDTSTVVKNEVTGKVTYVPADEKGKAIVDAAYYLETAGFAVFVGYDDYPLNEDDDEDKSYISANAQYVSDTEKITAVGILKYEWKEEDITATLSGRYDSAGAEVWSIKAGAEWAMAENTALNLSYELNTWDGDETGGRDDDRGIIDTAGTIKAELKVTF